MGIQNTLKALSDPIRREILELLKKAIADQSGGRFVPTGETAICYRESGAIINVNMTVYELGIHNGSKLMLI